MAGEKISLQKGVLNVPDHPVIPYIIGDGIGPDVWKATVRVLDAAVAKTYEGSRKIEWQEILAGEKAFEATGKWIPDESIETIRSCMIALKGPLGAPFGSDYRSLNDALRRRLDLYACIRPVRHYAGVPSPVIDPDAVDMVIFRENLEDIYAGIEAMAGSEESASLLRLLAAEFPGGFNRIRFGTVRQIEEFNKLRGVDQTEEVEVGIGIKAVSRQGTERLVRAAIDYALQHHRRSVTIVHKGNLMVHTEGAFKKWAYQLAEREYKDRTFTWAQWERTRVAHGIEAANAEQDAAMARGKLLIKDAIADIALQQVMTRPKEFDVIATLNQNGDYLSDALSAQVGGIGIAPGANINYVTGHAIFEATHGTAPKYEDRDMVNPSSLILSGVMMFEYMAWQEAADKIVQALEKAISEKRVTYDFYRLMDDAIQLKTSEFADEVIGNL
jgi:isocitrate dehydrogenase